MAGGPEGHCLAFDDLCDHRFLRRLRVGDFDELQGSELAARGELGATACGGPTATA